MTTIFSWRSATRYRVLAVQAFFLFMLVLPTVFQLQRGMALMLVAVAALTLAIQRWRVHQEVFFLWSATMVVGVLGVTWGVLNEAPGAIRVSTVHLVWPALYLLFIGLAHDLAVIRHLESTLLLGVSLATAMALTVLVSGLLGFGDIVYPLLAFLDVGFGAYEGFTEFRIFNLTTVMYGFPFVFALLLVRSRQFGVLNRSWLWFLIFLMVLVAIGSGRRIFWMLLLMTPLMALFFLQRSALRLSAIPMLRSLFIPIALAIVTATGLLITFGLEPTVLWLQFADAFSGQEESSGLRYEQADALWRAFKSSPLIGTGLGSTTDVIRSVEQPWAYELWYLSLLMSVGLLGFLVYLVAVVWIICRGMILASRDREFAALFVPLATALSGFLVMTATNPYLAKFDYLWVIFLPVALINGYLTRRPSHA